MTSRRNEFRHSADHRLHALHFLRPFGHELGHLVHVAVGAVIDDEQFHLNELLLKRITPKTPDNMRIIAGLG